jgi:Carbonic anhydrase
MNKTTDSQPSDALPIDALLQHNREWAARMKLERPGFLTRLAQQQAPKYMWIGCADSRVPANEITGLDPGEVFVHRNVANLVVHSDLNALSTIQFAVEHLKVKHTIGCVTFKTFTYATENESIIYRPLSAKMYCAKST